MSKHCKYPPSSASRWLKCPASNDKKDERDKAPIPEALKGVYLHEQAGKMLLNSTYKGTDIKDLRDRNIVLEYRNEISKAIGSSKSYHVEKHLESVRFRGKLCGTPDFIGYNNVVGQVIIADLKTGRVPVYADNNYQLLMYACLLIENFRWLFPKYNDAHLQDATFKFIIFSPNSMSSYKSIDEVLDIKPILDFKTEAYTIIDKLEHGLTETYETGEHCKWCPGLLSCRASYEKLYKTFL